MSFPALVFYATSQEYKDHFKRIYCRNEIYTFDRIRVYFKEDRFNHSFYESPLRDGRKSSELSSDRAQRIDWIKYVLESADSNQYFGWNKDAKRYEFDRRVSLVLDNSYVVVIELSLKRDGTLKANFVTAYVLYGDSTSIKIQSGPAWNLEECIQAIQNKKRV